MYYIFRTTQRDLGKVCKEKHLSDINHEKNIGDQLSAICGKTQQVLQVDCFYSQTQHGGWLPPTQIHCEESRQAQTFTDLPGHLHCDGA